MCGGGGHKAKGIISVVNPLCFRKDGGTWLRRPGAEGRARDAGLKVVKTEECSQSEVVTARQVHRDSGPGPPQKTGVHGPGLVSPTASGLLFTQDPTDSWELLETDYSSKKKKKAKANQGKKTTQQSARENDSGLELGESRETEQKGQENHKTSGI